MTDKEFLDKVREVILENLSDDAFNVNELAIAMGLSRSQLFRKLKQQTHHSATTIIRDIRLSEAVKLLREDAYTVSEVAYKVGFNSPSYFNKCFHDKYGYPPGEFIKITGNEDNSEEQETAPHKMGAKAVTYPLVAVALVVVILLAIGHQRNSIAYSNEGTDVSIAVLPFLDLSENQDHEYLAMGITDAIILELSKMNNLRVVSRGSAEYARDSIKLYPAIAEKLGVSLILEGSLVYSHDSLRVNVQLVKPVPEEKHIWAEKYEQSSLNIFQLTNSISRSVAREIHPVIQPEVLVDPSLSVTPVVFDSYLKARHLWQQQTPQSLQVAIQLLNQTVSVDSTFAPLYSLQAECYISLNKFIRNNEEKLKNREEGRQAINRALDKAIRQDGSLAEAYITKGNVMGMFDYNWEGMKRMAEKGLELNPSNAAAYISLSHYYAVKGEHNKSLDMALQAEQCDPLNPRTCSLVAKCYTYAGNYHKAIEKYNYVLQLFPSYGFAWDGIGYAWFMLGDKDKALAAWTELHRFIGNDELVAYYQRELFDDCIHYWLQQTTSGEKLYCSNPVIIAMVHLFVDDEAGAMDYIEFAYKYKDLDLPFTIILPNFRRLYGNPRFRAIAEQTGVHVTESFASVQ